MNYEMIFDGIHTAKTNADFLTANLLFAYLIKQALDDRECGLYVLNETQDEDGEFPLEAYYDLICIVDAEGNYACIRLPLLTTETVTALYKRGMVYHTDRGHHSRNTYRWDGYDPVEHILREAFVEFPKKTEWEQALSYLSLEKEEQDYLYNILKEEFPEEEFPEDDIAKDDGHDLDEVVDTLAKLRNPNLFPLFEDEDDDMEGVDESPARRPFDKGNGKDENGYVLP